MLFRSDLIMSARTKLCECGYSVEALCFDGLLILKQDIDEEILGNLSAYCEEKTGYNVNFEVKPMTLGIKLVDEETEFDFSTYEHPVDKLENYDQVYCETLQRENPYEQYALKKSYIEKFSCKVLLPEPQFVFQNGLTSSLLSVNKYLKLSKVKMKMYTKKYVLQEIKNITKIR